MMRILLVAWLGACGVPSTSTPSSPEKPQNSPIAVDPTQLRAAILWWSIGTNNPEGPGKSLETIYPGSYQGRAVWRAVHRAVDPTVKEFDFHMDEVDRETVRPVRSIFKGDEGSVTEYFADNKVRIERVRDGKTTSSEFTLDEIVMPPPGPGSQLLFGALPLREGYTTTFHEYTPTFRLLNSEPDPAQHGVRPWRLSVVGRETIQTPFGAQDTWVVVTEPADDRAGGVVKKWVRASPPHYALRVEYSAEPGHLVTSEATAILLEGAEATADATAPALDPGPAPAGAANPGAAQVNPGQLEPAMIFWDDPHSEFPYSETDIVQTFFATTYQGKAVWRGINRAADPTDKTFELYLDDVDAATLAPLRVVFRFDRGWVHRHFDGNQVKVEQQIDGKKSSSTVTLQTNVVTSNRGPGDTLFLAALPLREGYRASYHILDHQEHIAEPMTVSVVGRETIRIAAGSYDTFVVVTAPGEGATRAAEKYWVLASPPHYPIRTEWTEAGETKRQEATRVLLE